MHPNPDMERMREVNARIAEALARNTGRPAFMPRPRQPRLSITPLELALTLAVAVCAGPFVLAVVEHFTT